MPGRGVLLLISLHAICLVLPVHGECDPSHAVVAVASVLSTLGFVIIVLALAFLIVRWRRRAVRRLDFGEKRDTDGHVNSAFIADDNHLHPTETLQNNKSHNSKPAVSGISNEKTWSSLPRKDPFFRLSKEGSYGSLNGNQSSTDPEVVSVTLESQDIIGLGFNICGSYNDGIRVSEINSRGPAKECGDIKVGDKIISVTVSYEHIVYEDALTILSYASPYPVKIRLQKASGDNLKTFDGKKIKIDNRRLSHPLFRSHSLEAVKRSSRKEAAERTSHPKRTQSDLKSGHKLLKWPGKHSKKERGGSAAAAHAREEFVAARWRGGIDSQRISVDVERDGRNGEGSSGARLSWIQDSQVSDSDGDDQFPSAEHSAVESDLNLTLSSLNGSESRSPKVVPDKPERKNRRKSDVPVSLKDLSVEDMIDASNAKTFSFSPPSDENNEDRIVEEVIVPEILQRARLDDSNEPVQKPASGGKDIEGALNILRKFTFKEDVGSLRSPSPDRDPVEEEFILPESKTGHGLLTAAPPTGLDSDIPNNNNNDVKGHDDTGKPKNLNEEILEMIIAMNSFPPGTQGWAGLKAGGQRGGFTDDFVPSDLGFVPQPVPREAMEKRASPHFPLSNEGPAVESRSSLTVPAQYSNRGLAYEIRDDLVTGRPFAVELNKHRQNRTPDGRTIVRSASEQVFHSNNNDDGNDDDFGSLHTSFSFDASTSAAANASPEFNQATWNMDIGQTFSYGNDWSGHRLVRSDSVENIFVKE